MVSQITQYSAKDVIFIGSEKDALDFKQFLERHNTLFKSFRFLDHTQQPQMLEHLKDLDFTQVAIVKSEDCSARLVPAPFTTPSQLLMHGLREIGATVIGVVGTKGKTITSALLHAMLNQRGYATLCINDTTESPYSALEQASNQHLIVIELSSMALADLEISPNITVITNLYREHIDYHGSLNAYWEAIHNSIRYMTANDKVVFAPETEIVFHWLAELEAKQELIDPEETVDFSKSTLFGKQNALNFLLAKRAAGLLGVDAFGAQAILKNFETPKHRLQNVRTVRGITFINNAISKDPTTTHDDITSCIREVGPVGCVMIGGKDVNQDFSEVVRILSTLLIPKIVLFPETAIHIKLLIPETYMPEIFETDSIESAVFWAAEHCPSGSVCLFSPASPPLKQGTDYTQLGAEFEQNVMKLSIM
jgi:UDP-N-acetylmuramoylalanine--D-glutamate ligase